MRRVRDARGETGRPAQSRARATYVSNVSVALHLSASESASAPASPIWFLASLQRGDEGQGCSWRDRAVGTDQDARDLLERRQRRVALERLRERRGALVTDLVAIQAAAVEVGQACSWRERAAGAEQGARDLQEKRQHRVALERLGERHSARLVDLVVNQAAARRGGSAMLLARQGCQQRAGARDLQERSQRRVALERLRKRSSASVADLVVSQAATRRGG